MSAPGSRLTVSKYKTPKISLKFEVGGVLAACLRDKGWTIRDTAEYLGVSRQRLYSVFADPRRIRLWECAVAGLPVCSGEIKKALQESRRNKPKPTSAVIRSAPAVKALEFEVGDVVIATDYVGAMADEDDEGWITGVRDRGEGLELQVRMPGGEDWFHLAYFNKFFMTNGKTRAV